MGPRELLPQLSALLQVQNSGHYSEHQDLLWVFWTINPTARIPGIKAGGWEGGGWGYVLSCLPFSQKGSIKSTQDQINVNFNSDVPYKSRIFQITILSSARQNRKKKVLLILFSLCLYPEKCLEPKLYVCFNMLWDLNHFHEYIYPVKKEFQEEGD